MNRKEISEIKRQFTPESCAITRICGCYVDAEKNKKTELKQAFLSLSEEEMFKYFDIFRKTLSGTVGRNLMTMEFPLSEEAEGGRQEFLLKLRTSRLQDDSLLDRFYDKVIELYDYPENYYIILIHGVYDIPGKSTDGLVQFDASEEIYDHLLFAICPVNLSKAGLCYNAATNAIEDRIRDWIVEMPDVGFLFPSFEDRRSDIHHILYYARKPEELHAQFADQLLGCRTPLSAGNQQNLFNDLVEETLGEDCDYDTVVSIHDKLHELILSQKEEPDPVSLTRAEVRRLLEASGAPDDKLEDFDTHFSQMAGEDASLMAANITNIRRMQVRTPDVVVQVAPERSDLIEVQMIEGRRCLVVPLEGDVEVNGISVHLREEDE